MTRIINANIYSNDTYINSICINEQGKFENCQGNIFHDIDMKGRYIYPAFIDCHLHLVGYGQNLSRLSVKHLASKTHILEFIQSHHHLDMIYVENYAPLGITSKDLDLISKNIPIYLRHQDFHGLTVNSFVLNQLHIQSIDGILLEEQATTVLQSIKKHSKETLKHFLRLAYNQLLSYGVVAGHSDDLFYFNGFEETTDVFLDVSKDIPFYSHLLMHYQTLQDYARSSKRGLLNPYIYLGEVKMFYDGTTTSKTALMNNPYHDDTFGERIVSKEAFIDQVKAARSLGLAVAIHVIGDLGLEEVCQILKAYPVKKGLKDRIIHASYATNKAVEALKEIPCFIDFQPQFVTSDFPETFKQFKKDPELIFPLKTYHTHGLSYGLSSDAPVEIPNPLFGIHAAVTRRNTKGTYQPNETISLKDAFLGYTKHAWQLTPYQAGEIKVGYHAHFIVLDFDLFTEDVNILLNKSVLETWIDGKRVFQKT